MYSAPLLISDEDRPVTDDACFERLDPFHGAVVTRAAAASVADAQAAASAAAAAFPGWSGTAPSRRRAILNRAADLLDERSGHFIEAMSRETGASAAWGGFNCQLGAAMLREAAAMTTQITGEVIPSDKPGMLAMALRQPAGVCVGIAPWNAPVVLGARAVAMPLACGNTVVLKSAEACPMTHRMIADVLRDAGVPAGAINVISNAPADARAVVDALVAHPAVRRVSFTGSTRIGRLVAQSCAVHLKRVLLELGGKAPFLVLEDADLDAAAAAAAFGAFFNQGQLCISTERLIVDERIADAFIAKLTERTRALRAGPPGTEGCVLGAMISREAVQRLRAMIDDALQKGGRLVVGGEADGTIMQPTLIDHVTADMQLYRDEIFGPIAAIVRVQSVEEAISVANDTEYGLAASIYGRDVNRALAVARQIDSGICHVNSPTVQDEPQMPFGGVKGSGYGRFGGKAGIDEFTELRWVSVATEPPHLPF